MLPRDFDIFLPSASKIKPSDRHLLYAGESKTVVDTAKAVEDVVKTVSDIESGNVVEAAKDVVSDIKDVKNVVADVEKVKEDLKGEVNVISSSGIGEDNRIEENFNIDTNPDVNEKVFGGEDPWMKSKENVDEVD